MDTPHNLRQPASAISAALERIEQVIAEGQASTNSQVLRQRARRGELKHARAALSDVAWELEEIEQRLRDLEGQRAGPTDMLAERELSALAQRHAALEEQALQQMIAVDQLAGEVQAAEQALAQALRDWDARAAALWHEHAQISQHIARGGEHH